MKNDPARLCREWHHAPEESSTQGQIYYADDYPLPPSRGRTGMRFEADGTFVERKIAPACGFESVEGTWQWQSNSTLLIQLADGIANCYELEVISLTEQKLWVR